MKEKQILAIVKKPGGSPEVEPMLDNSLDSFCKVIGDSKIKSVAICTDMVAIVSEDYSGLPFNCKFLGSEIYGPILLIGTKGYEFSSLKASSIPMILRELGGSA